MSQDTERTNNSQANNVDDKNVIDDTAIYYYKADNTQKNIYTYVEPDEEEEKENTDSTDKDDGDTDATENLEDEDFSEDMSDEDKETIKKVANDDNVSQAKSYASILVEQVMDAKETFERSLGSLFTSAFTAGLEIGISFFMILAAFSLLSDVLPSQYSIVLASLLYPIGFIIVVIGQSLLFTEQTSLLSLPVLNKIEPLHKLLRLWSTVIAGNVVGGCLFAALMVGLGLNMQLFSVSDIDTYAEHILGFEWWVIFGSSILAGWMMGVAAWLVTSARDTLSRIVLVTLITGSIGFLGLHHSIVGNIEVFSALLYGNTVSLWRYLLFLALVLVGNTIGGVVFVAVLKNRTFLFQVEKVKEQTANDKAEARINISPRRP
ncbi:formate/nitrite transporter family protein [Psychrobacter sp. AOP22-C1-22]|uniref:formate/nitrite transporter family protein n=1 Tax=unclassified Psychrobacter TaxID=196806 RepID=UPI00178856E4|nr:MULTISPECIES: formate/nitrite transporter family protein [unclassified Psychrobacter]MDN5801379.1 formate/nitrite transporter family protein [Psychrobacter sp.]MBE0407167.1 formate/nitrite transporter family protein [Psychrobacter sp. FME6]MBE0445352.1 formate/nitrite transporter family protein [Psychrobacter sp. FME5]MDN5890920.1 formate/nitrite transporter family protein [Psychrobacter sp.]MDN5897718.1 formate/nitrite transporter family protein [Psychrobacter sp.]